MLRLIFQILPSTSRVDYINNGLRNNMNIFIFIFVHFNIAISLVLVGVTIRIHSIHLMNDMWRNNRSEISKIFRRLRWIVPPIYVSHNAIGNSYIVKN